jgi:sterol desaturase/sphingolipid hydroxylase (fatty acid hydroxylase superfamily)
MSSVLELIESTMARILTALHDRLIGDPLGFPFIETPDDRLYLPYVASFLVISLALYLFSRKQSSGAPHEQQSLWSFLFPRSVFLHRSAIVDYKFYVVNRVFSFLFMSGLGGVGAFAGAIIAFGLQKLFGPVTTIWSESTMTVFGIIYFLTLALAADLGFFLSHYLHHKSKFFWEFHKVHHSAEVLTPITNYRFHPMEKIVMVTITGSVAGFAIGVFLHVFGEQLSTPTFLRVTFVNVGVITFVSLLFANHRHSHIWLSWGPALEHIFISPAQHQMHHSCEDRHIDTNFGLQFALWDWMAGTLYVPHGKESFAMGLQDREHEQYQSVLRLYFLPFRKAFTVLSFGAKNTLQNSVQPDPKGADTDLDSRSP